MKIPEQCDVVVIGGGPAGSLAGTYLAQKGYDVVLLEKQQHPRYSVGESLIPDFWKYCDIAGATEAIENEGFLRKGGGTIVWKGQTRTHSFKDFGYSRPALHVERDRFDYILLQNAIEKGVHVFEQVAVSGVKFDDNDPPIVSYRGTEGEESGLIECKYVLDASGQSSVLAKQLGLRQIDEAFRHMSVWGYFEGSKYVAFGGDVHSAEDVRDVYPTTFVTSLDETGDSGWSWHIVLRDNTSVGLVLPQHMMKTARNEGESWEDYFVRRVREVPTLGRLLEDATFCEGSLRIIRDYSYVATQVAGPGYYLIGDAAGFHDPIFSIGIVLGMYSAYAAAWSVDRCIKSPESEPENQAIYSKTLRGRVEVARSLALPQYRSTGEVSDMAKSAISMERDTIQDLMFVVSELTSRSENFKTMVGEEESRDVGPEKLRVLDGIHFA